jgi:hypothetical protein
MVLEENDDLNPDEYLVSHFDLEANQDFLTNIDEDDEGYNEWGGSEVPAEVVDEEPAPAEEVEVEKEVVAEEPEEPEEPTPVEEEVVAEAPAAQPTESTEPTYTQEQLQDVFKNWSADVERGYKELVNPDIALQVLSNPEEVLPRLLTEVHTRALRDATAMMQNMIPQATQANLHQMVEARTNEELFFAQHEDLKTHKAEFDNFLFEYRSLPRNTARDFRDISQEAATVFRAMKGLHREVVQQEPEVQRRPPPPAIGGAVGSGPKVETNPYAALAEDFLREDM